MQTVPYKLAYWCSSTRKQYLKGQFFFAQLMSLSILSSTIYFCMFEYMLDINSV